MRMQSFFGAIGWLVMLCAFRQSEFSSTNITTNPRLFADGWFALSAENQACYLQTYRLAAQQLKRISSHKSKGGKRLAIVTDLDETLLDNSPWTVKVLLEGTDYPAHWGEWEKAGKAPAFPGAVAFFQKAAALKIEVFYISNRMEENLEGTIQNLKMLGLPNADASHVFLKTTESNKVARRQKVLQNHDIVMLLGDNLADFDGVWEKAPVDKRLTAVTDHTQDWGSRFIIFPNPVYGSWKDALFDYKRNFTPQQEDSVWNAHLNAYMALHPF